MKKSLMFVFILAFTLPFTYGGCNGGGGGGDNNDNVITGTAPEITSVQLFKVNKYGEITPTLTFSIGDLFNIHVSAFDVDLDMAKMFVDQFLLPNIDAPYYPTIDLFLPMQNEISMIYYLIESTEVQGPAGDWRICFLIVDSAGNESNEFCVNTVIKGEMNYEAESLYEHMEIENN